MSTLKYPYSDCCNVAVAINSFLEDEPFSYCTNCKGKNPTVHYEKLRKSESVKNKVSKKYEEKPRADIDG